MPSPTDARDRWDFSNGAFTFKLARLEKRYQQREELLNRQIREKAMHQRIARESSANP